jgi:hypothetical protein
MTVIKRGVRAEPVSMSLTVRAETPERSARLSCESSAADRNERSNSPSGSATVRFFEIKM